MKSNKIPKQGTTLTRKDFWDTVLDIVGTQKKVEGRNVKVTEFDGYGTIIDAIRERAATVSGCGACSLPDCVCPHAISCEIKFDSDDTSGQDFLEIWNADGTAGFGLYTFHTGSISIYSLTSGNLDIAVSGGFANVWHSVCAQFCRSDNTHIEVTLIVDGVSDVATMEVPSDFVASKIYAGAKYGGGVAKRTLRCVSALGAPGESNFNFPADSFDSLTAGASIVDGALRIESTDSVDAYGEKTLSSTWDMVCLPLGACCAEDETCTITKEADCVGEWQGADTTCDPSPCPTCVNYATICVTFAGIETCSCEGVNPYYEISDVSMNGTFEIPRTVDASGGVAQWEGYCGTVHLKQWGSPGTCEGTPVSECDSPTYMIMQCIGPPATEDTSHFIGLFVLESDACLDGAINLFQVGSFGNGNVVLDTPESNINDCMDSTHGRPLGQNGTVTIAAGACP